MEEYGIKENIKEVENQIAAACQESGRAPRGHADCCEQDKTCGAYQGSIRIRMQGLW